MKITLVRDLKYGPSAGRLKNGTVVPAGTVYDHPKAYELVQNGDGIPADDECREACGLTDEQIAHAIRQKDAVAAAIHPDDYPAYFRGELLGYNPDGSWIPGPNYVEPDPEAAPLV